MQKLPRLVAWLFPLLVAALLGAPLAATAQTPLQIVTLPGVSADAAADFQRALSLTQSFFLSTYNVPLTRTVRVILVPDRAAFVEVLVTELGQDRAQAERTAAWAAGLSSGYRIIMISGGSTTWRVILAAHELTHQYQAQIAAPVYSGLLKWLQEGTADAVGARVSEMAATRTVEEWRRIWLNEVLKASRLPDLNDLRDATQWSTASAQPNAVNYELGAVATLLLVDRGGWGPLLTYYQTLRQTADPSPAFQAAFGRSQDAFVVSFREFLRPPAVLPSPVPTPVPQITPRPPLPTPRPVVPVTAPVVFGSEVLRIDRLIRPADSIGPVKLGTPLDEAIAMLGPRYRVERTAARGVDTVYRWDFPDLAGTIWVYTTSGSRSVTCIETTIPTLRTTVGNSTRAAVQDFRGEFGPGFTLGQTPDGLATVSWSALGVWVVLDRLGDRIVAVGVGQCR